VSDHWNQGGGLLVSEHGMAHTIKDKVERPIFGWHWRTYCGLTYRLDSEYNRDLKPGDLVGYRGAVFECLRCMKGKRPAAKGGV
jgi:hypothetical protein